MYANYHTHTARCHHAKGSERDYVEQALAAGLGVLGFSDHTPYYFPGDYYSGFRMRPEELDGYVDTILALKEEYAGRIDIRLGLEVEYYPDLFPRLLARLRETPIEYILLGQHCLDNEIGSAYCGRPNDDEALLVRYVDQCCAGMQTGLFTYLAHPDLFYFVGSDAVYEREMRHLCRAAKSEGVPLEINLLGLVEGRNYPDARFWPLAAAEGNEVILGRDAHDPAMLTDTATLARAEALAERCGLRPLTTVPLRPLRA